MESEMPNNHYEKEETKEMIAIGNQLKRMLDLFLFNALVHQIEIAVKSQSRARRWRHEKEMKKFRTTQKSEKLH